MNVLVMNVLVMIGITFIVALVVATIAKHRQRKATDKAQATNEAKK